MVQTINEKSGGGAEPDGTTVVETASGALQSHLLVEWIADLEVDAEGWVAAGDAVTTNHRTDDSGIYGTGSKVGSWYWFIRTDTNGNVGTMKQTFDVTTATELVFWVEDTDGGNGHVIARIGGENVYGDNSGTTGWVEVTVDISDYSGEKAVELGSSNNTGNFHRIRFDGVRLIREHAKAVDKSGVN